MRIEVLHNGEVVDTKDLGEGSYKIGRASECDIQLKSPSISKQHALLVVKGNKAAIVDLGSANGVFVNGILVRKQRIEPSDEVKIVDFQLRLGFVPKGPRPAAGSRARGGFDGNLARNLEFGAEAAQAPEPAPALSAQEKFLQLMDQKVMVPYFSLVKTFDWRWVLTGILLGALLLSVLLSVIPIVRWGRGITTKEALARAHTICAQTVRENYRILSKTNDPTRLTVEAAEAEKGVLSARIIDPRTNSVLAPAKDFNKTVNDVYSLIAIKRVTEGKEDTVSVSVDDDVWLIAQPINVYSPETNENVLSAIVLIQFQITSEISSTFQPLVEAALFATLFSLGAFFLIFKMFTYPIQAMGDQLDAALKGDNVVVASEMKMPELENLATQVNFALARLNQASGGPATLTVEDSEIEDADFIRSVQELDQGLNDALLLLDKEKTIKYVGRVTEDLLSLRSQYAVGQNLVDACKDAGFSGTAIDLANQVIQSLGETQTATLDINGFAREMSAIGHKNRGGDLRFILIAVKMRDVK